MDTNIKSSMSNAGEVADVFSDQPVADLQQQVQDQNTEGDWVSPSEKMMREISDRVDTLVSQAIPLYTKTSGRKVIDQRVDGNGRVLIQKDASYGEKPDGEWVDLQEYFFSEGHVVNVSGNCGFKNEYTYHPADGALKLEYAQPDGNYLYPFTSQIICFVGRGEVAFCEDMYMSDDPSVRFHMDYAYEKDRKCFGLDHLFMISGRTPITSHPVWRQDVPNLFPKGRRFTMDDLVNMVVLPDKDIQIDLFGNVTHDIDEENSQSGMPMFVNRMRGIVYHRNLLEESELRNAGLHVPDVTAYKVGVGDDNWILMSLCRTKQSLARIVPMQLDRNSYEYVESVEGDAGSPVIKFNAVLNGKPVEMTFDITKLVYVENDGRFYNFLEAFFCQDTVKGLDVAKVKERVRELFERRRLDNLIVREIIKIHEKELIEGGWIFP